uniref:Heat shock protein binding protein, putative n=1 Tax=Arundo donax TaxID=35708 RepID=A0A0A9DVH2_ARUDO
MQNPTIPRSIIPPEAPSILSKNLGKAIPICNPCRPSG